MPKKNNEVIASIDIGSAKILVLVAELDSTGLHILGIGSAHSDGIKNGVVVDIDAVVSAVKRAVSEAEHVSNICIDFIIAGVSGLYINSLNSTGRISIRHGEVDESDVARVLQSASAITLPANQEILHTLPRIFILDGTAKINHPIGMHGSILEAQVHIVTNEKSSSKNIVKSITQCSIDVTHQVFNALAASKSALTRDEKKLGVCLIDIGSDITDVIIFSGHAVCYSAVLPIAGNLVTTDVMYAFTISQQMAETLKLEHGCALAESVDKEHYIGVANVEGADSKKLSSYMLAEVIEARYEEIFTEVRKLLQASGYDSSIASGIVLTGGAAKIKHCTRLSERIFNKPTRIGENHGILGADHLGSDPSYSVVSGLLMCDNKLSYDVNKFKKNNWQKNSFFSKLQTWLFRF